MKGLEISFGVNAVAGGDINVISVDSDKVCSQGDVFEPLRKMDKIDKVHLTYINYLDWVIVNHCLSSE